MKKLKTFSDCKKIILCDRSVYGIFQNNVLNFNEKKNISICNEVTTVQAFSKYLLLSNNKEIGYLHRGTIKPLDGGGALISSLLLADYIYIPQKVDGVYRFFLYDKNLKKYDEIFYLLNYAYSNKLFYYDDKHVKRYDLDKKEISWQIDISGYGKYIDYKGDERRNEIDGKLLGMKEVLYIPLKGGQLVAIDVKLGEKLWILEHRVSGRYVAFDNKIYKKNKVLYEIDTASGEILQQFNIDLQRDSGCFSHGPMWVYDDIIILTDILRGGIMMISRENFKILDIFCIDSCIANRKSAVIWHNKTLYILDADNTLHILK